MINLNTREFTYVKEARTFVADASDLEAEHPNLFEHKDIELRSEKTDKCLIFSHTYTAKDDEGVTIYWRFSGPDGLYIEIKND